MTAPVLMDGKTRSQAIAMTAPVLMEETTAQLRMAFVMPSKFTKETLPLPKDERVLIREVPERVVATISFSWYAPASRKDRKAQELLAMLKRDGVEPIAPPEYAGYNPPFSVPFLKRHEILIEIAGNP